MEVMGRRASYGIANYKWVLNALIQVIAMSIGPAPKHILMHSKGPKQFFWVIVRIDLYFEVTSFRDLHASTLKRTTKSCKAHH